MPGQNTMRSKFDRSVSLLAWGYNEEALIGEFLRKAVSILEETVEDFEIVFVDDGSTDKTGIIAAEYARGEHRLRVITHQENKNVGACIHSAVIAARKDFLFWQTVDWSYDIRNLRIILELLKHFDVVQGARPTPERPLSHLPLVRSLYRAKYRSDTPAKAFVSLANYYVLKILFMVPFQDFQNVTFYPRELARKFELKSSSAFTNPELLLRAYAAGARIIEVPIKFIPRAVGVPKGTRIGSIARAAKDILRIWINGELLADLHGRKTKMQPIRSVSTPFQLDEDVIRLVAPLYEEFR